jgi:general secretion pathway protein D
MISRNRLNVVLVLAALTLPAYADQGKAPYAKGEQAEQKGNYDAAYGFYKDAHALVPGNAKYFSAYVRVRFRAAAQHVHDGQLLRTSGALTQALGEFQRAADIDTTNLVGQQELLLTKDMISRRERQQPAPNVKAPSARLPDDLGRPLELRAFSNAPITMYLTANADAVYKTIGKIAGFNVLVDPDYKPQKITVDLTNVTLREALEMVRLESKTFWRPVLSNAIFVSADSPTKRKELEQNVMKTFYLQNIESPNELQEAANVVKQMLDVTRVQLVQAQDALIMRGTPDQMVLAEKLLADFDKPKSEVVIDVAVMEVSRDRIRTLGTNVPTSFSAGLTPPATSTTSSGTSSGSASGFTLSSLSKLSSGNLVFSIPGASFSVLASDSNTKLLQNPEIRVLNNEKATLRIGDRVPIATGSFSAGISGGGGVNPLVSTQFQYLDVGVNIDITPHIHADGDVTLKMSLEISSVSGEQNIGGITEPVIGQRRIEHETRLTDGEVNLLGGILEDTETQSMSGYPWLSKIPILKYLFAQDNKERQENEIVFAITPHIVRSSNVTEENTRLIEVGTANSIELRKTAATVTPAATPQLQ